MTALLPPLVFEPLLLPKPWGGRRLGELFAKPLPPGVPIGESWELVSLPGHESQVRTGPYAGRTLHDLVTEFGSRLLGDAAPQAGRFPLLIKFLDARENLSVQVHPRPEPGASDAARGVKHEAWYVLAADRGARIYAGLRPGVTPADLRQGAATPAVVELLREWPAVAGDCFYLPSGTLHALGAGVVVAEVQTPSDVTYRLYDWNRRDSAGRPRELHLAEALANIDYGVTESMIAQPPQILDASTCRTTRRATCAAFTLDHIAPLTAAATPHTAKPIPVATATTPGTMLRFAPSAASDRSARPTILIVLRGEGTLTTTAGDHAFSPGDVILIPATTQLSALTFAPSDPANLLRILPA